MDINKLQINDFVECKHGIIQVKHIFKGAVYSDDEWNYSEVEPIRLTSAILEANGFKLHDEYDWFVYDKDNVWFCVQFSREYETDEIVEDSFLVFEAYGCTTVHELQHVLRIAELDDFANNLIIPNNED